MIVLTNNNPLLWNLPTFKFLLSIYFILSFSDDIFLVLALFGVNGYIHRSTHSHARHRPLSSYYKVQETEKDYICSLAKDSGMHSCSSLPPTKSDGRYCNDSAVPGVLIGPDGLSVNGSCINWNQYYTDCRAGEKNPFQGAISFDNIGLAWVAIFLVSLFPFTLSLSSYFCFVWLASIETVPKLLSLSIETIEFRYRA